MMEHLTEVSKGFYLRFVMLTSNSTQVPEHAQGLAERTDGCARFVNQTNKT
jgi:hypothetical protein